MRTHHGGSDALPQDYWAPCTYLNSDGLEK